MPLDGSNIIWRPQPGPQEALLACPIQDILFGGARGGGKTGGAIGMWLAHAGRYGSAAIGVFFRRQFRDLGGLQTQMTRFFRPLGAIWRQRDSMWIFPNGATLLLRHIWDERDADSYQGHEYTFLCFEEVGQWPSPKPIDMLRATLRSTAGVKPILLLTGNPGGAGHQWLKNRYIIHAPNGYRPIVAPDTGELRVFIPSKLSDNAILLNADPNYARRLQQVGGPALVKAWLNGDWDIVAGGFFDDIWNPEKHVLPQFRVPDEWQYRRAFDWGSSRPAALGVWAVADGITAPKDLPDFCPPKGSIVLAGELYTVSKDGSGDVVPNVGLEWTNDKLGAEMAKTTKAVTNGRGCRVSVADPSIWKREGGPSIYDQMKAGAKVEADDWGFVKADNSRISGWQMMRTMLRQAAAERAEGPGLWVMDNNPEWLRTVPVLQRDRDKIDDVDTEGEDHHGDQTRYAVKAANLGSQYVGVAPVIVR